MDVERISPKSVKEIPIYCKFVQYLAISVLGSILSGCMVGPDFHSPCAPCVSRYTEKPVPHQTVSIKAAGKGGVKQTLHYGRDMPSEWWRVFHSDELNYLICVGVANNANFMAAKNALWQAKELLNAQIGSTLLPQFGSTLAMQRQLFPGTTIGVNAPNNIFNVFTANVNVSYTLDIFGGARRAIEAQGAQVDFQQFEVIAAYLTLTSNIVTTSFNMSSLQAQLKATFALLKAEEGQLNILRKQYRLGGIAKLNVLQQETIVNQTRAQIPQLQKSLSQQRHALGVLMGVIPNKNIPAIDLDTINLPKDLPVSIPCQLVRQRPDVRAAEALLHAASAQIGVATANMFPQLTITGNYGWSALVPHQLFGPQSEAWFIAGTLTQSLFQGGALVAQRRAAIAAYQQSFENYRQTVLQAFQNVADVLRALETDARTLRDQKRAEIAARNSLSIAQQQYRLGGIDYLTLLIAQQQYQQAIINRIQSQALRYSDTAALFQALGGGWWHQCWFRNETGCC